MKAQLRLFRVANERADGKGHDLPRTALLRVRAQVEAFLTDTLFAEPGGAGRACATPDC